MYCVYDFVTCSYKFGLRFLLCEADSEILVIAGGESGVSVKG